MNFMHPTKMDLNKEPTRKNLQRKPIAISTSWALEGPYHSSTDHESKAEEHYGIPFLRACCFIDDDLYLLHFALSAFTHYAKYNEHLLEICFHSWQVVINFNWITHPLKTINSSLGILHSKNLGESAVI